MSSITAQTIVNKCRTDLKDAAASTWTDAMLLSFLNDGQREIVSLKPKSYLITSTVNLVPGTRQSIPTNAHAFFDALRNMGVGGATPGRIVVMTEMATLDRADPYWHAATASVEVVNVMKDSDPKQFWVSPPQPDVSMGSLEIQYSIMPVDINLNNYITLEDNYANALYFYVMARAHAMEEVKADSQLVAGYMGMFTASLEGQ